MDLLSLFSVSSKWVGIDSYELTEPGIEGSRRFIGFFQIVKNDDKNISKDGKNSETISIGFFQLYRFATKWEVFAIFWGFIFSAIKASALPAEIVIYSEFTAMLVERSYGIGTTSKTHLLPIMGGGKILTNASRAENNAAIYNDSISFGCLLMIVQITLFLSGIFAVDIFNYIALKQVTRMRIKFFTSTIRQDIGWHDTSTNQNIALRITDEIEKIRDGISEKISHFLNFSVSFVITTIIAFIYGWKLSLAVSAYIPIVIITNFFVAKYQSKLTKRELDSYSSVGNLVEEVFGSIRTVIAFGGEKSESKRYDDYLVEAKKAAKRKAAFTGLSDAVLRGLLFISCAGAFWYGANLILNDREKEDKEYTPAILMIAIFGIISGADNVGRCAPFLESLAIARGSATTIFQVIDSTSKIDPLSEKGDILNSELKGDIEFKNVFFRYPSREDVIVLRGLNIKIESGKTVALVGSSGCGKSTCIQLLQRFYDPISGQILFDDMDIKKYNISWLRSNIAIVGQEPVLFQGTIGENIKFGKPNATQKEIEAAAKNAGAHDFIAEFPNTYGTWIGEKGAQLSGGQKQRIAIARALVQDPKILLLDEATSALDYESEKLVQEALDKARKGRTTIIVSHRLSAIIGADKIVFIENGKKLEEGSHAELMKLNGRYYQMVIAGELQTEDVEPVVDTRKKSVTNDVQILNFDMNNLKTDNTELQKFSEINYLTTSRKEKPDDKTINFNHWQTFLRILGIGRPVRCQLIWAVFFSFLFGAVYPIFSISFGEFYAALALSDKEIALDKTRSLSFIFLAIGIGTGLICFFQIYIFNSCGAWVTAHIRSLTFQSIIRQDVGWFDSDKNSVGALSARLAGDAANVQAAIGYPLSGMIQGASQLILSAFAGFYFSWELTLICIALVPFMVGSVVLEAKFMAKTTIEEKEVLEEASRVATESINQIRTVAGLRREKQVIEQYTQEMLRVEKLLKEKLRYRGVVNSFGNSLMYFGYAITLSYGGILVSQERIPFQNIIKVSEILLFGAVMFSQSLAFAPAFTAALVAGHRLFEIIDLNPRITSPPPVDNDKIMLNQFPGVKYQSVKFSYPSRPEIPILQGLDLEVLQGKTVGLVGHSGCGKSTCIQLLQRFYDPEEGKIKIEQGNIRTDMTLESLRSKLGIVSQEPVLFERTIAENIAYGDNTREISLAEVMDASKQANAHSFIITLPLGYDTCLGARGTQLSGGQKQRIAIARALIRNPKILLLDEATSALDLQSEKIVQSALDMACSGRTCIVIAHRLSTIQNADLICVFDNGKIVERGNHQELLSKNGIYYKLYKTQLQNE